MAPPTARRSSRKSPSPMPATATRGRNAIVIHKAREHNLKNVDVDNWGATDSP